MRIAGSNTESAYAQPVLLDQALPETRHELRMYVIELRNVRVVEHRGSSDRFLKDLEYEFPADHPAVVRQ
jgi:hypothetical protein